ncbi:MAG: hypothetical protein WC371_00540 [Parachlamydiales bacterium]|jgi:hypothetical protein
MFCWLFLFFCSFLFGKEQEEIFPLSSNEQVASYFLENCYIGDLISPLNGALSLAKTDLIVKGAQEIVLFRAYIAPYMPTFFDSDPNKNELFFCRYLMHNYRGWVFYPEIFAYRTKDNLIRLVDANGMVLEFTVQNGQSRLASSSFGMCNLKGEEPSGKNDPRNFRLNYAADGKSLLVFTPNGSVRHYRSTFHHLYWVLEKEILPSGKALKYYYDEKNRLCLIESRDPKERFVYASLKIEGDPKNGHVQFTADSGRKAFYEYELREKKVEIKSKHGKSQFFFYGPPLLTKVSSPFYRQEKMQYCGRFMLGNADSEQYLFSVYNTGFGKGKNAHLIKEIG